ncbi:hypothetical protein, partial [Paenibacillus contaminans]|uniref:hypothetical protein n=1 Tax=Paenibacillus contaminans TaxID=450362 RepID=UPI001EDF36F9
CRGQIVARRTAFQPNSAMPRAECCTSYSISAEFGHAADRLLHVVQHFSRIRPCRGQIVARRTTFQPHSAMPRADCCTSYNISAEFIPLK